MYAVLCKYFMLIRNCLYISFVITILTACAGGANTSLSSYLSVTLNSPSTINVGDVVTGTVNLNGNIWIPGTTVQITSSNSSVATVTPTSCLLSSANPTCSFSVTAVGATNTGFTINANATGYSQASSQIVYVNGSTAGTLSMIINPNIINVTETSTATITLNDAESVTNLVVNVTSSNESAVIVSTPASCTIISSESGQNSCTVTLSGTSAGSSTISANATGYVSPTESMNVTNHAFAYFANQSANTYTQCPESTNGLESASCVAKTPTTSFISPYGIAIHNRYAYITNSGTSITRQGYTVCYARESDGTLVNCSESLNLVGVVNKPTGVAISNDSLYILNYGNDTYTKCSINNNDGSLSGCTMSSTLSSVHRPVAIAIHNGYAYITNDWTVMTNMSYCQVAVDGSLQSCAALSSFSTSSPMGLAIKGDSMYIANSSNNKYNYCTFTPLVGVPGVPTCDNGNTPSGDALQSSFGINIRGQFAYFTSSNLDTYTQCNVDIMNNLLANCVTHNPSSLKSPRFMAFSDD